MFVTRIREVKIRALARLLNSTYSGYKSRMRLPKPTFFFVPGVFLMTLGSGNFIVGSLKLTQYQEVTQELAAIHPGQGMFHLSPLRRLQMINDSEYRLFQQKQFADARKDFYRLIKFGGKIFMAISIPFLLLGTLLFFGKASEDNEA